MQQKSNIKEDSCYFNNKVIESLQQNREVNTFSLNELFEAKKFQNEDSKSGSNTSKMNTIKRIFNKQIKSYVLSINECQINSKQNKVLLQINNVKAQTLVFQIFINKISLDITAVSNKNQVLRLKIFPGAKYDFDGRYLQNYENNINGVNSSTSTTQNTVINKTCKPKFDEVLPVQQTYHQTQETVQGTEDAINNFNGNDAVACKQIIPNINSQENKFFNYGEDFVLNSDEKSLSLIVSNSLITQRQQQKQELSISMINNTNNNNGHQNDFNSQGNCFDPSFVFYMPSDDLIKEKWINLIVDLKSFFQEISEDFVVQSIQIGQQCRLKSIFYSKQSDINASDVQNELLTQGGSNKFIPQIINYQQMSQTLEKDQSLVFPKKEQCNHTNFLLPNTITSTYLPNKNPFQTDSSQLLNSTSNIQNRYQNRQSGHLSNCKHSQISFCRQNGSSKSHSKQSPPPISQNQSPSAALAAIVQQTSVSCSHTNNTNTINIYKNPSKVSKLMRRRESKNIYSRNSNQHYNNNFQKQKIQNNQSLQQNQQKKSYLSSNISFDQQPSKIINSNIPNNSNEQNTQQNILYYQSTCQSTDPNYAQFSDEQFNSKILCSGPYTQRTSSVYFQKANKTNPSNVCSGLSSQPSYHGNSSQQYQNSYLNNSLSVVGSNSYNLNRSTNYSSKKNNSIRLPKIISLLKQRSSSIYGGVTNRSYQIVEEIDINGVQSTSNFNSAGRTNDTVRIYNKQVQNKQSNGNNLSDRSNKRQQSFSYQHKTQVQNKFQIGQEALLIQNGDIKIHSPSKIEINRTDQNQQIYRQSQQRFNTMSLVQSPRNHILSQNTFLNLDILPNETSINLPNSNDLYNITDQAQSKIQDGEILSAIRVRQEEDENKDQKTKVQNCKVSIMNKLSSVIFKNNTGQITIQNKENDPRYRNSLIQKQEMSVILKNKRRSRLFSTSSINNVCIQQNNPGINANFAKGSLYSSRKMKGNCYQEQISPLQHNTQQSLIQNDEDLINMDSSSYGYYAPNQIKFKGSQSPSQIVSQRNSNNNIKKRRQSSLYNNINIQMSILNSPQSQSQDQQCRNYIRKRYSIDNKRFNPNQKQNQTQKMDEQDILQDEKNEIQATNEQYINAIQNEKIERKRRIIIQQQQKNKDNSFQDNNQPLLNIEQSRGNYHQPPPVNKNLVDNSLDISYFQNQSKIQQFPSHILQHSLQAQITQFNNQNSLLGSNQIKEINQEYQPQQLTQFNYKKQIPNYEQQIVNCQFQQNSKNQSPKINQKGYIINHILQNIVQSNNSNNITSVNLEIKRNSIEKTPNIKQTPSNIKYHSQPTTQSSQIKKCVQKSNFCQFQKQQREVKNQQMEDQLNLKLKIKQKGQNNKQISLASNQDCKIKNEEGNVVKTEETPNNTQFIYDLQKNKPRKVSDVSQKSTSRGRSKKSLPQNILFQPFNQTQVKHCKQQSYNTDKDQKNEQVIFKTEKQNNIKKLNQQKSLEVKENQQNSGEQKFEQKDVESQLVELIEDESQVTENNEQQNQNFYRFSSSFNNPELISLPLTFIQKDVETFDKKSPNNKLPLIRKIEDLNFQIGFLNSTKTLTASNIQNMNKHVYEMESQTQNFSLIVRQESNKSNGQLNKKMDNSYDKIFQRKFQKDSSQNKITIDKNNNDIKLRNSRSMVELSREIRDKHQTEEIIELQRSECVLTQSQIENAQEEIEEKIDQTTLTEQRKSIKEQKRKALATSGSVYQSEHITSEEEECNESGLAISIQVENIDLLEKVNLQPILPHKKRLLTSSHNKENCKSLKESHEKRKYQNDNKFIQEIEGQIPSCNSIEVSRVVIVQDDDNDYIQNINKIKCLPHNSDWKIQSFLIENKTDILKNRNNLNYLIKGKDDSLQTQCYDIKLNYQQLKTETDKKLNKLEKDQILKLNQLSDDQQICLSKICITPQILHLNDVVTLSD